MTRRIKIVISTDFENPSHEDYKDLPKGWDEWPNRDRSSYLAGCAKEFLDQHICANASVEEC